jgi:hypothetical protein
MMNYLIIQPWFFADGHPAQSLVRTVKAISPYLRPKVLVFIPNSCSCHKLKSFSSSVNAVNVDLNKPYFERVLTQLGAGTFYSIAYIKKYTKIGKNINIFFLDSNLYILSLSIYFHGLQSNSKIVRLGNLCLVGPEYYQRNPVHSFTRWRLVKQLFKLNYFHLYLRTEELADAWKNALPAFSEKIDYLPSLELQGSAYRSEDSSSKKSISISESGLNFLVAGKIRPQKSVYELVSVFSKYSSIGTLNICGKISEHNLRIKIGEMVKIRNLKNIKITDQFLSEEEIRDFFSASHYNLMLYKDWDMRMESAMLYESMKYLCPVVVYVGGWLENKVKKYGLGWSIPRTVDEQLISQYLGKLPSPFSKDYLEVLENLRKAHDKLASQAIVQEFLYKLDWIPERA